MLDKSLSHIPATAGADFLPISSKKLTFDSTVVSVPLILNITLDQVLEDTEGFSASLTLEDSSHRGVIELNPNSTDITIIDSNSEHHVVEIVYSYDNFFLQSTNIRTSTRIFRTLVICACIISHFCCLFSFSSFLASVFISANSARRARVLWLYKETLALRKFFW